MWMWVGSWYQAQRLPRSGRARLWALRVMTNSLPPGFRQRRQLASVCAVVLEVLDDVEQGDGVEVVVREGEGRLGPLLDHLPADAPPRLLHGVGGDLQAVRLVARPLQRLQEEAVAGADVEHPAAWHAVRAQEPHQVIEVLHLARMELEVLALEIGGVVHRARMLAPARRLC